MRDRLNGKQKAAINQFEAICGFEFMYIDDINAGEMSFAEAWNLNIKWLEDVVADVTNINLADCGMLKGLETPPPIKR